MVEVKGCYLHIRRVCCLTMDGQIGVDLTLVLDGVVAYDLISSYLVRVRFIMFKLAIWYVAILCVVSTGVIKI